MPPNRVIDEFAGYGQLHPLTSEIIAHSLYSCGANERLGWGMTCSIRDKVGAHLAA